MFKFNKFLFMLFALLTLTACGGGGGSNNTTSIQPTVPDPVTTTLSFQPLTLSGNYKQGTSLTLTTHMTLSNGEILKTGLPFIKVIDTKNVLTEERDYAVINTNSFSATFHTSPQLPPGLYQGTLQFQLCANEQCSMPYMDKMASLPYSLTVTEEKAPLQVSLLGSNQATIYSGSSAPKNVSIDVKGSNLSWTAKTNSSWLKLDKISGKGNNQVTVQYNISQLSAGDYKSTIVFESDDGQKAEIPFNLTVLETQFNITSGIPSFNAVNGSSISPQKISFELTSNLSAEWKASTLASWLKLDPSQGITPGLITLKPDTSNLKHGSYQADISLMSDKVTSKTIPVELELFNPILSSPTNAITFGGVTGKDFSAQKIFFSLNTDQYWNWEIKDLPVGITSSLLKGKVNQDGAAISFSIDPAQFPAGTTTKIIRLTSQVNGDLVQLPLTLNVSIAEKKLLASEWGVAFTSKPDIKVTEKTIEIRDNYGQDTGWTATSDQSWLTVTSSGNTLKNNKLTLRANADNLPSNALSYATITLHASEPAVKPIAIKVGLWKDGTSATLLPPTKLLDFAGSTSDRSKLAIPDKIRPYVYSHAGSPDIDIYNVYNTSKVATIDVPDAFELGSMAISADGSLLYVVAIERVATTTEEVYSLRIIDLSTLKQIAYIPISENSQINKSRIVSISALRINGTDIVLDYNGMLYVQGEKYFRYSKRTGIYTNITGLSGYSLDGTKIFLQPTVQNRNDDKRKVLGIDISPSGDILTQDISTTASNALSSWNITVNTDGSRVYNTNSCNISDTTLSVVKTFSLPSNARVTGMSFDSAGRSVCGFLEATKADPSNSYSSEMVYNPYLLFFDATGKVVKNYSIPKNLYKFEGIIRMPDGLAYLASDFHNEYLVIYP